MAFPDPEWFTFEDIAARWVRSLNYVGDCARTGKLKVFGRIQPRTRPSDSMAKQFPSFKIVSYVKREDLYAFEERFGIHVNEVYQATQEKTESQKLLDLGKNFYSVPEGAIILDKTESTIRRWIDDGTLESVGAKRKQRRIPRSTLLALINTPT